MSGPVPPSILLIDDQEPNRYWMQRALTKAGFTVAEAGTGAAGLAWLEVNACDLVLLDVGLPDLSGYEVCRRLKLSAAGSAPLVILISARFTGSADRIEGLEEGADGFLTFPLEPAELVAQVRALLRLRMAEQRARLASLRAELHTVLSGETGLTETLQEGVEILLRSLDAAHARLWLLDEEGRFRLKSSAGAWSERDSEYRNLPLETLLPAGSPWQPHVTFHVGDDPQVHDGLWAEQHGLHTYAGYPLHEGDRLLGYVALWARQPLFPADTDALVLLAESLGRYIHRKQVERALRRSEERFRQLFDSAGDVIYNHDLQGRFTAWNRKGEELTGYAREDMLAMTADQLIAPEFIDLARTMTRRKLAGEHPQTTYEVEVIAKDGSRVPLEVSSQLLWQDGVVVGVTGLARDIRERRQLQEQLLQSQKMEAVGLLAGGVAHDFNNMLAVINGYCDLLRKTAGPGPVQDGLGEIRQAGERAAALTRQLLAFSRKQIMEPKVLHVGDLLRSLEKLLRPLIGEDIDLRVEIDGEVGHIRADPHQMEQVVVNLAVNSRDAMPRGGTLVLTACNRTVSGSAPGHEGSAPSGSYVEIAVRDTGTGMPPEVLARIWEPFFTTKDVGKGTGLGLSTAYGIVRQSGGFITAESTSGQGCHFRMLFPEVESPVARTPIEAAPAPSGRETVLLVEDEVMVRRLYALTLRSAGYLVLEAGNGEEAILVAREYPGRLDLVVTDVVMPGSLNGRTLAERLRLDFPTLPVLYMTGYTEDTVLRHGVSETEVHLLRKPFTPNDLLREVHALLAQQ